jgi:hypothetical protein
MRRDHPVKHYCFKAVNGGGTAITANFRAELRNQNITVTVVDSDKLAPCDSCSATKTNLQREAAAQTFLGVLCETPCREIENFIPFSILKNFSKKICPNYKCFDDIENLLNSEKSSDIKNSIWLYLDLKEGIKSEKLNSITNVYVRDWLSKKFKCENNVFEDIEIEGFGPSVLRQFLNCGEALSSFSKYIMSEIWKKEFYEFFDIIYWHFVACQKESIR